MRTRTPGTPSHVSCLRVIVRSRALRAPAHCAHSYAWNAIARFVLSRHCTFSRLARSCALCAFVRSGTPSHVFVLSRHRRSRALRAPAPRALSCLCAPSHVCVPSRHCTHLALCALLRIRAHSHARSHVFVLSRTCTFSRLARSCAFMRIRASGTPSHVFVLSRPLYALAPCALLRIVRILALSTHRTFSCFRVLVRSRALRAPAHCAQFVPLERHRTFSCFRVVVRYRALRALAHCAHSCLWARIARFRAFASCTLSRLARSCALCALVRSGTPSHVFVLSRTCTLSRLARSCALCALVPWNAIARFRAFAYVVRSRALRAPAHCAHSCALERHRTFSCFRVRVRSRALRAPAHCAHSYLWNTIARFRAFASLYDIAPCALLRIVRTRALWNAIARVRAFASLCDRTRALRAPAHCAHSCLEHHRTFSCFRVVVRFRALRASCALCALVPLERHRTFSCFRVVYDPRALRAPAHCALSYLWIYAIPRFASASLTFLRAYARATLVLSCYCHGAFRVAAPCALCAHSLVPWRHRTYFVLSRLGAHVISSPWAPAHCPHVVRLCAIAYIVVLSRRSHHIALRTARGVGVFYVAARNRTFGLYVHLLCRVRAWHLCAIAVLPARLRKPLWPLRYWSGPDAYVLACPRHTLFRLDSRPVGAVARRCLGSRPVAAIRTFSCYSRTCTSSSHIRAFVQSRTCTRFYLPLVVGSFASLRAIAYLYVSSNACTLAAWALVPWAPSHVFVPSRTCTLFRLGSRPVGAFARLLCIARTCTRALAWALVPWAPSPLLFPPLVVAFAKPYSWGVYWSIQIWRFNWYFVSIQFMPKRQM